MYQFMVDKLNACDDFVEGVRVANLESVSISDVRLAKEAFSSDEMSHTFLFVAARFFRSWFINDRGALSEEFFQ